MAALRLKLGVQAARRDVDIVLLSRFGAEWRRRVQWGAATGRLRVHDAGNVLGSWRRKCLQLSVAECLPGDARDEVLEVFADACRNNLGSGVGGGELEAANFRTVLHWLEARGRNMWVYEVDSAWHLLHGHCRRRWLLGAEGGRELGCLAWYPEGHVARIADDDGVLPWGVLRGGGAQLPPWQRSVAGAPKKSKRGAHLVGAGNEISVKGNQGKKRQKMDEGAGQGGVVSGGGGAPAFDGLASTWEVAAMAVAARCPAGRASPRVLPRGRRGRPRASGAR